MPYLTTQSWLVLTSCLVLLASACKSLGGDGAVPPARPAGNGLDNSTGAQKLVSWHPIRSTGDTPADRFTHKFYHAYPLDAQDPQITQLIVVVHGASGSEGDYTGNYFDRVFDALEFETASDGSSLRARTQVINPHFRSLDKDIDACDDEDSSECLDHVAATFDAVQRLVFSHGGWREGASTTSTVERARVSSFQIIDDLLKEQIELYPNLQRIIITGHSAGGQFVNRYAAAADFRVAGIDYERLIDFIFMPANPSSMFYIDNRRPDRIEALANGFVVPGVNALPTGMDLLVSRLDNGKCETENDQDVSPYDIAAYADTFNDWKYGLDSDSFVCAGGREGIRTHCHIRSLQLSEPSDRVDGSLPKFIQYLIHNIKSRRTVFLAGNADTAPNGNLDDGCEANLMGISRFIRAQNYAAYWEEFDDWDNSVLEVLDGVAHSGEDVYRNPTTNSVFLQYVRDAALGSLEGGT